MELHFKPNKRKLLKYLMSLYGIGKKRSIRLHKIAGLNLRLSSFHLLRAQKLKIVSKLNKVVILHRLRKYLYQINSFAYKIRSRKGIRNKIGLPSRGQQTRTNAKTKKKFRQ